ncbi:MAG: ABC transporter permease [Beijerinckiaceae bacterium]
MLGDAETRPRLRQDQVTLILLAVLVAALSVTPLVRLLWEAVAPGGALSGSAFERVWSSPAVWRAFRNSLETSFGATALALASGTIVALIVTLTDIRARHAFVFVFVMPLIIAPQVMALAWLQVSGPSSELLKMLGLAPPIGTRNPLYSREGIILLLAIEYAPLVFLTLRAGLRALPRELIEAALSAGASKATVVRTVILPLMTPSLMAGAALVFVSCLGNFGVPAFLGIPGGYLTLPTLIYQRLSGQGPGVISEVAVLSVAIGVIALAGIAVQDIMLKRRDYRVGAVASSARPFALGAWRLPVEMALWSVTLAVVALPILGLLATALVPAYGVPLSASTASAANFSYVIFEHQAAKRALVNSFTLSAAAAIIITALAVLLAYFVVWRKTAVLRWLNIAAELPYALPGVVLSIACILLFLKPLPVLGLSLYNTIWILLVAYLARFLVLGLRPVVSGYHQLDRAIEEAAQVAGAGFLRRLVDIILPVMAPVAAAGAIIVFLTAFNELTVSALLWSSGAETLGVVVFSFEQGGESAYAAALSLLTILVTVALALSTLAFHRRLPQGVLPWRD